MNDKEKAKEMKEQEGGAPKKRLSDKAKLIIVILSALLVMGCVPFPYGIFGDVGSGYEAVLWSVSRQHKPQMSDGVAGYLEGTRVRVLFFTVYDDVRFVPDESLSELFE